MEQASAEGVPPAVFRVYDAASRGEKPSPQDISSLAAPQVQASAQAAGLNAQQQQTLLGVMTGNVTASSAAVAGTPLIETQLGLPPGTLVGVANFFHGGGDAKAAFSAAGAVAAVAGCAALGAGVLAGPICGQVGGRLGGIVYNVGDQIVKSAQVIFTGKAETCDASCLLSQQHDAQVWSEMRSSRLALISGEADLRLISEFEVARVYNQAMKLWQNWYRKGTKTILAFWSSATKQNCFA